MSREIKFRAWNTEGNKCIEKDIQVLLMSDGEAVYLDDNTECLEPFPSTIVIEQYTGLKDKNGVEIYEGDIIDIIHPCWIEKAGVKFLNGSFIFDAINQATVIPGYTIFREKWELEIIGNIHQ